MLILADRELEPIRYILLGKPTRPGSLRNSNIQQAATGAHSDLGSAREISSWSAATHRARVFVDTSSGAGRTKPEQDLTRALQKSTRQQERQVRRGRSREGDPAAALPASSRRRCLLSSGSFRSRCPHVGVRPGTHSFPTWKAAQPIRGQRRGKREPGARSPGERSSESGFPWGCLPLGTRLFVPSGEGVPWGLLPGKKPGKKPDKKPGKKPGKNGRLF